MKKSITAIAVFTLVATAALAQHGGDRPRRGGPPPSFIVMFGDKLALTDAQKQQIQAIEAKTREDNAEFFAKSRQLMEDFRAAREANDTAKLESLRPAMKENREQMMKIHQAELDKILPILTADQRAQFEKLRAEREAQHKEHAPKD